MQSHLKICCFYNYSYQFSAKIVTVTIKSERQLKNNRGFSFPYAEHEAHQIYSILYFLSLLPPWKSFFYLFYPPWKSFFPTTQRLMESRESLKNPPWYQVCSLHSQRAPDRMITCFNMDPAFVLIRYDQVTDMETSCLWKKSFLFTVPKRRGHTPKATHGSTRVVRRQKSKGRAGAWAFIVVSGEDQAGQSQQT